MDIIGGNLGVTKPSIEDFVIVEKALVRELVTFEGRFAPDIIKHLYGLIKYVYSPPTNIPALPVENLLSKILLPPKYSIRGVMDALFRSADPAMIEPPKNSKQIDLPSMVKEILEDIENGGYQWSLIGAMEKLRHWEDHKDEDLSDALRELRRTVESAISWRVEDSLQNGDFFVINKLVAQYCGVSEERFRKLRQQLLLKNYREKLASDGLIGVAEAREYYLLGRMEFYGGSLQKAESAFEEGALILPPEEPRKKDYYLTLGLVQHYLGKWKKSENSYQTSLDLRESEKLSPPDDPREKALQKLLSSIKFTLTHTLLRKLNGAEI